MKELKILTICGLGFGTSLMMLMTIQDIGKKHGVKIVGEATDLGSYKGRKCDVLVASSEIASQVVGGDIEVVSIQNMLDKAEIEKKMKKFF